MGFSAKGREVVIGGWVGVDRDWVLGFLVDGGLFGVLVLKDFRVNLIINMK